MLFPGKGWVGGQGLIEAAFSNPTLTSSTNEHASVLLRFFFTKKYVVELTEPQRMHGILNLEEPCAA